MRVFIVDDRAAAAASCLRLVQAALPTVPVRIVADRPNQIAVPGDMRRVVICVARHLVSLLDSEMLGALAGDHASSILFVFDAPQDLRGCTALFGPAASPARLTDREAAVHRLLAEGLSNKSIAAHLGISLPTVKTHLAHLLRKLGAQSRDQAMVCPSVAESWAAE